MSNRSVRSLSFIEKSASTARVLNLHVIARRQVGNPDMRQRPLFQHPLLNRGIYLKHRVRPHEIELFDDGRTVATKVLLPLDPKDLRAGGRYVFIGERNFDDVLRELFGDALSSDRRDRQMLDLLQDIPSLDPFLLREHLRRNGMDVATGYFELSEADLGRIFAFVERQVHPLVALSMRGQTAFHGQAAKLVKKMMSGQIDGDLEPLRQVLRLAPHQFAEGVFCWKGFLYYKWALGETMKGVPEVSRQIAETRPHGPADPAVRAEIEESRINLRYILAEATEAVRQILNIYDRAFAELVECGDPQAFRDFLLAAPARFEELGDRLGAISHMVSFWTFRFPANKRSHVTADELADIFMDFENGLAFRRHEVILAA